MYLYCVYQLLSDLKKTRQNDVFFFKLNIEMFVRMHIVSISRLFSKHWILGICIIHSKHLEWISNEIIYRPFADGCGG